MEIEKECSKIEEEMIEVFGLDSNQYSNEEIRKEFEGLKKDMAEIKKFTENFEKKFTQLVVELAKREYYRRQP